ncbi:MAG: TIGR03560 family F420-dependent LLM class oxidoreductase [Chloroflexota bacterium]
MRFGAAFWLNRTSWPALREAVQAAERAGFESIWVDDHLLTDEGPWDDPKFEGWTTLAALAPLTERATLGLLVGANTLRNPGLTAKLVTTLDHVSGGRAILGLGAGWFRREHEAFGFDFGASMGERLDRLEESIGLIRRLLAGERFSHAGRFYAFDDALISPRPLQARLPILIGGSGRTKTLRTVARHAEIWNAYGTPAQIAEADAVLREHCAAVGRDEREIERSVTQNVVIRGSRAAAEAAYELVRATHHPQPDEDLLDAGGTVEEVAETLRGYAGIGVSHSIWIFRDPFDLETMSHLAEVRAHLAS